MLTAGRGEIRDMLERSVLTIDGVQTPIAQGGAKDAQDAVVFVHGNPGPSEDWDELAPRAAEFARVLTMDMPGYGRADRPRDFDYTMAGYARHLEGILKATGIDGAHLVTHDFGHARAVCRLYRATKPIDAIARAMAPKLRAIDPPTLVIWGTGDAYLPEKYAAAQKETFPKAEVHLLHGCGHWPFIDDPRAVEERLLPFLRRQWASR